MFQWYFGIFKGFRGHFGGFELIFYFYFYFFVCCCCYLWGFIGYFDRFKGLMGILVILAVFNVFFFVEILGVFLSPWKFPWYFNHFGEGEREREELYSLEVKNVLRGKWFRIVQLFSSRQTNVTIHDVLQFKYYPSLNGIMF